MLSRAMRSCALWRIALVLASRCVNSMWVMKPLARRSLQRSMIHRKTEVLRSPALMM